MVESSPVQTIVRRVELLCSVCRSTSKNLLSARSIPSRPEIVSGIQSLLIELALSVGSLEDEPSPS